MNLVPKHSTIFVISTILSLTRLMMHGQLSVNFVTARKGMKIIFNIKDQLYLLRVLHHPQTERMAINHPKLAFKYLDNYVSLNLSTKNRILLLTAHYSFLQRHFRRDFLDIVEHPSILLWEECIDSVDVALNMDFPKKLHAEGDLCLTLTKNGQFVYRLIFIIAKGDIFGISDDHVILISSIQGVYGFDSVKSTTKACHDIHPTHLLMAAVSGVASAIGINTIFGIKSKDQIANNDNFHFSYDLFFKGYGDIVEPLNLYRIPLPFAETPIHLIKSNHKKRTLEKRLYKGVIRHQSGLAIKQYLI
jgi:uncharacterized protein VirK/YbjX